MPSKKYVFNAFESELCLQSILRYLSKFNHRFLMKFVHWRRDARTEQNYFVLMIPGAAAWSTSRIAEMSPFVPKQLKLFWLLNVDSLQRRSIRIMQFKLKVRINDCYQ